MHADAAVIEREPDTGGFVAYVTGFLGAHSQRNRLDALHANLREVITMFLEASEPRPARGQIRWDASNPRRVGAGDPACGLSRASSHAR